MTTATVVFVVGWTQDCPKNADVKISKCIAANQRPLVYTWTETHPIDAKRRDLIPENMFSEVILIGCGGEITCIEDGVETYYFCNKDVDSMVVSMTMLYYSLNRNFVADGTEFHVEYDGKTFPKFTYPKRTSGYRLPGIIAHHDPLWRSTKGVINCRGLVNFGWRHIEDSRGYPSADFDGDKITMLPQDVVDGDIIARVTRKHNELRDKKRVADENYTKFCDGIKNLLLACPEKAE